MFYNKIKGFSEPKPRKSGEEMFLTAEQVDQLLQAIEESDHPARLRDHAAIFLGFYFALRCGEAVLLDRECFGKIEKGVAYIPTLKRGERVRYQCPKCGRRCRVAAVKVGRLHRCSNCQTSNPVRRTQGRVKCLQGPPLIEVPFVEKHVKQYVEHYLEDVLPPDQRWLFESIPGRHIVPSYLGRVFSTYARKAGLSPIYSWHALRHGRGVQLWEVSQDLALVQLVLRHSSLSSSQVYVHLSPMKRSKYLDLLEREAVVGVKKAAN